MENLIIGLRKLIRRIGIAELVLCKIILSWIVLLTGVSILLRYGFNYSLHWSQEIILLSAQYLYFLGAAYIFKAKEYIIMEYFFTKLPEIFKIPTIVIIHLLMLLFLSLVVWQSFLVIMKQWSISSFVLNLPRGHWTIPVLLGCISIALTLIYYLLVYLKYWGHGKKPRPNLAELELEMDLCL